MCTCKSREQTTDHILFDCELVDHERDRLKAAVLRSENIHNKNFKKFTDSISFDKL
jgi:hypothetical protein